MANLNLACKCINKNCENHGNCKACREYHEAQPFLNQTYCQAGSIKFITKGLLVKLKIRT